MKTEEQRDLLKHFEKKMNLFNVKVDDFLKTYVNHVFLKLYYAARIFH